MIFYFSIDTAKDIRWFTSLFCFCSTFIGGALSFFAFVWGHFADFTINAAKDVLWFATPSGFCTGFVITAFHLRALLRCGFFTIPFAQQKPATGALTGIAVLPDTAALGETFPFFERHSFCAVAFCFAE